MSAGGAGGAAKGPAEPGPSDQDSALSAADGESVPPVRPVRPIPQYGEYATPEEVAIARGIPLDRGANEHVSRLAQPITPPPTPHLRHAPPPTGRSVAAQRPAQRSSLLTVLLLVFGIWNTVTGVPNFLDLGRVLSQGFETLGYGTVAFGNLAQVAGIVMLVFSFLVLIAAVGLSLWRIRAGKPSLRVPILAGVIWSLGYLVATIVVVANTPGATALIQNHS